MFKQLANLSQVRSFLIRLGFPEAMLFDPADLVKNPVPPYAEHALSMVVLTIADQTNLCQLPEEDKTELNMFKQETNEIGAFRLNIDQTKLQRSNSQERTQIVDSA